MVVGLARAYMRRKDQPMVDKQTRQQRIRDSLVREQQKGLTPADLWKEVARFDGPKPRSRQAIYKWFQSGEVAEDNLPALAFAMKADLDHLRLVGEFRPPRPSPDSLDGQTPWELYVAATALPPDAQTALLSIAQAMLSLRAIPRRARR
jgi:hypothetical protein